MLRFPSRTLLLPACWALLVACAAAQQPPKVSLDTSEVVFTVVTAINTCGYDQELSGSEPVRAQVRAEVARAIEASERTQAAVAEMCRFYRDHRQVDASRDLAQYVSLALNLGEPPAFAPASREADLPPDASYVLGFVPLLQRFYINTDLHQIWLRHTRDYSALVDKFHSQIANMLLSTDVYLKMPVSGYVGRRFVIYLEPMAAPGQVNARNYGADYSMVVSPEHNDLRIAAIRHTYLHFILDPLTAKRGLTMKRLEPIMDAVKTAPMDEVFKNDVSLMVTESLIRAVEARTDVKGKGKQVEAERNAKARQAAEEGFVLAPYFNDRLAEFEKEPEGLRDAFPNWLHDISVSDEKKKAAQVVFASTAAPESMHASRTRKVSLLDEAERRLASGDLQGAREMAQQALDEKREELARALFILARVASLNRDVNGAQAYFQRALVAGGDARLVAWSHIYLGRIFDLKAERDNAVQHYRAALQAGDDSAATRAAAERGLQQPYAPPAGHAPQPNEEKQPN